MNSADSASTFLGPLAPGLGPFYFWVGVSEASGRGLQSRAPLVLPRQSPTYNVIQHYTSFNCLLPGQLPYTGPFFTLPSTHTVAHTKS